MRDREVESILDINENELDREWLEQARKYYRYATDLAEAKLALNEYKANIDVVEAELDSDIRQHPTKYGLGPKVTENSIASTILIQKSYQEAVKKHIQARYEVDMLEAAVSALEHRKKALEMRVILWLNNYNSEPKLPKGSTQKERERVSDMERDAAFSGRRKKVTDGARG